MLEQQLQDCQPLGPPQANVAPHSSTPQPPVSRSIEAATQTYEAAPPVSTPVEASTQTETAQPPISTSTDKSRQTDRTPRSRTVQETTSTEPPTRNYEEEIAAQIAITEKTKKRHKRDITQLQKL